MPLKDQILKTAAQMFWNIGIKRVGIDDICNELRISKKTFYAVFKTKSELIESILEEFRKESRNKKKYEDSSNNNIIDALLHKTHLFKQQSKEGEKFLHINFDLKKYYPEIYEKHCNDVREDSQILVLEMLEKGIEQGLFRDNMDLNLMKKLISDIFSKTMIYFHEKKISWTAIMDFIIDTIMRIVCNDRGMEYYLELKTKS